MGPHLSNAPQALHYHLATYFSKKKDLGDVCLPHKSVWVLWVKDHAARCSLLGSQGLAQCLVQVVLNEFLVNTGEVFNQKMKMTGSYRGINQCIFMCGFSSKTKVFLIYQVEGIFLYFVPYGVLAGMLKLEETLEMRATSLTL